MAFSAPPAAPAPTSDESIAESRSGSLGRIPFRDDVLGQDEASTRLEHRSLRRRIIP